jgi:dTDP-4-amino-4,6-dideoxygalactose transaminase
MAAARRRLGRFRLLFFLSYEELAAAGAGMVTARDPQAAERIRMLRHHGSRQAYLHEVLGYNSRLDELQAAILRVKLAHLERFNAARAENARLYGELLAGAPLALPQAHGRGRHIWHQYTVRSARRDELRAALERSGIASMIYYPVPLHRQPLYAPQCAGLDLPVTEEAARTVLSLPMYAHLGEAGVRRVCQALRAAL